MAHVDALSRNVICDLSNAEEIQEIGIFRIRHDDLLYLAQMQDVRLKYINEVLDREARDEEERKIKKEYSLKDGCLFKRTESGLKWAVPRSMRRQITALCHDEMGHVALEKTLHKMQDDYWFPGMRRYARACIRACIKCFFSKKPASKKPGELHPI